MDGSDHDHDHDPSKWGDSRVREIFRKGPIDGLVVGP